MKNLKDTMFNRLANINGGWLLNAIMPNQANKALEESQYHQQFTINANSLGYSFGDDDRPERIIKSFIAATSAYLSKVKVPKEEEAVALVLTDVSGNFKFAGYIKYHANENADEPGNWSYELTFNEADLTELESERAVKKYLYGDTAFQTLFDKISYDIACIQFQQDRYMYDACLLVVDTLLQILDGEAIADKTVDIELPGYFTASVAVENGEKIFAITPDGHQKSVAKGDEALEIKD